MDLEKIKSFADGCGFTRPSAKLFFVYGKMSRQSLVSMNIFFYELMDCCYKSSLEKVCV